MQHVAEAKTLTLYPLHPRQASAAWLVGLFRQEDGGEAAAPVEELLYGGQAGGGKSYLLRALAAQVALQWPGSVTSLLRRSYPELGDSHIRWVQHEVSPPVATFHVQRSELRWFNGSVTQFRHAIDDAAVFAYNTAEFAGLFIDQAEQFTEFQLRFLRSRVRQPRGRWANTTLGPWRPIIVYSANPGGPAHQYLRDGFVDAAPAATVFSAPVQDGGLRRCYLPARLSDNPSLDAAEYRRVLEGLPAHLRRAYLEGDWSAVVGAFFTMWRPGDLEGQPWHVWPLAFARERYGVEDSDPFPPPDWLRWAGVDGGVRDPWCVLWLARAPDRRLFVYRERYAVGVQVPDQAKALQKIHAAADERLNRLVADPAMFARRANLTVSDAEVYAAHGVGLWRGSNQRAPGWRRVAELLSATLDDGYPQLVVLEGAAPTLVRTLAALLADPLQHEDVDDRHGQQPPEGIRDDPADALRYACMPAAASTVATQRVELVAVDGDVRGDAGLGPGQTGFVSIW